MSERTRRDEGRALDRLQGSGVQVPAAFSGGGLTREQAHVARLVQRDLAQIAGIAAKTAYAQEMVERLGAATFASGMRAMTGIMHQQHDLTNAEAQRVAELFAQQVNAQTLQYLGALAAIGSRRIADLADRPFDPLAPRGWRERLWEG